MWNTIDQLYGGNIGCGPRSTVLDTISRLFAIEQQLVNWERQLPPSLNLCNVNGLFQSSKLTDSPPSSLDRFRIILKLRHHNLRILLHRPILVEFLDIIGKESEDEDAQEASPMHQIGFNSIKICVQSSMEIVAIVRSIVMGDSDLRSRLGAWWFSLYYTFNAALVIFASILILQGQKTTGLMPLQLTVSELDLQRSLVDAALALRGLDCENRMVDRCAVYVEQLASVSEALSEYIQAFFVFWISRSVLVVSVD